MLPDLGGIVYRYLEMCVRTVAAVTEGASIEGGHAGACGPVCWLSEESEHASSTKRVDISLQTWQGAPKARAQR
jgi:hypothetical protein